MDDDLVFRAALRDEISRPLAKIEDRIGKLNDRVNQLGRQSRQAAPAVEKVGDASEKSAAKLEKLERRSRNTQRALDGLHSAASGAGRAGGLMSTFGSRLTSIGSTMRWFHRTTANMTAGPSGIMNFGARIRALGVTGGALNVFGGAVNLAGQGLTAMASGITRVAGAAAGPIGMAMSLGSSALDFAAKWGKRGLMLGAGLVGWVVKDSFEFAESMQRIRVSLKGILKDEEAVNKMIADLKRLAIDTPFNFGDVAQGGRLLAAVGFQAKDITPALQALADAVAKAGGGNDALMNTVDALGQMSSGLINTRLINRFVTVSIPLWDILAKKIGLTQLQLRKLVMTPGGGAEVFKLIGGTQGIVEAIQESAEGSAKAMVGQTWQGAWSNFQDAIQQSMEVWFTPLLNWATARVARLSLTMGPNLPLAMKALTMGKDRASASFFAKAFGLNDDAAQIIYRFISTMRDAATWISTNWPTFKRYGEQAFGMFKQIVDSLQPWLPAALRAFTFIVNFMTLQFAFVTTALRTLAPLTDRLGQLFGILAGALDELLKWILRQSPRNVIGGPFGWIGDQWKRGWGSLRSMGDTGSPSGLRVTSNVRNYGLGSLGSDHLNGRAFDVAGSNLMSFASAIRAEGGFAELHGVGAGRHAHTVPGDTSGPFRPSRGGVVIHPGAIQVAVSGGGDVGAIAVALRHEIRNELDRYFRDYQERA